MKTFYAIVFILISLKSFEQNKVIIANDKSSDSIHKDYSVATFAAGSFWQMEALFESIKGVKEVLAGYAGGIGDNPTYESIKTGTTGYAEAVMIYYDPKVVAYATLAEAFFAAQNPTQVNGQGRDQGSQYRSIAFFRTPFEKQVIDNQVRGINASHKYLDPVATQVVQFTKFWIAEDSQQDYIAKNINKSTADYIHVISIPAIKKFQKQYPQLIKPDHFF